MSRAAVVDVTVDDDLNIFTLALLGGRPHVMSCSLLTHGKRKVRICQTCSNGIKDMILLKNKNVFKTFIIY